MYTLVREDIIVTCRETGGCIIKLTYEVQDGAGSTTQSVFLEATVPGLVGGHTKLIGS